ncbi:uncharacterized protein LOC120697528 [Panicum virgatum]|uniref:uncharacterized protein LOC120697528 n=1 Tax=Panicum virgatum TaxID=38727 RepID=UPI0019D5CBF2|nr:uncharacterized protein LOC120697528 [Panicum virgatum]
MPFFFFFFSSPLFPFSALVDRPYVRPWEHRRRPARPPTARALGRGTSTVCLPSSRDPPLRLPPSSLPPNPPCAGGRSAALPSSGLQARSRRPGCSRASPPAACRLGRRRREERSLRARLQLPAHARAAGCTRRRRPRRDDHRQHHEALRFRNLLGCRPDVHLLVIQSMIVFFNTVKFGVTLTHGNLMALGRSFSDLGTVVENSNFELIGDRYYSEDKNGGGISALIL